MNKLVMSALFAVLLAGCASTQTPESTAPVEDRNVGAGAGNTGASTAGTAGGGVAGSQIGGAGRGSAALRDPNNILSKRSIYFELDSDTIRDEYRPMLEAHARYLQANRTAHLTIQGNTDERGSREYNIALGQRRADAAKRLMQLLGASESQIDTVSFGKEKPKNPGHDEAAYAENRRDDLVHQGE